LKHTALPQYTPVGRRTYRTGDGIEFRKKGKKRGATWGAIERELGGGTKSGERGGSRWETK